VTVVYRRTERDMPASPEEYQAAKAEGIAFQFLRAPLTWSATEGLVCSVMEPGPADARGRSTPVATRGTEVIPADAVIAAVGAEPDPQALAALGIDATDPALIGDAARGPETIVKAIASARAAVEAICAVEGGSRAPAVRLPAEDRAALRAHRDRTVEPAAATAAPARMAGIEANRCHGCRALCLKCVEVCPNRANTTVRVAVNLGEGFRDTEQVVHLDAACNECGTCATFCPWDGKPYRDKLTVFATEQDFLDSTNPGFYLRDGGGKVRHKGAVADLAWSAEAGVLGGPLDERTRTIIDEIARNSPWLLLGGTP